MRIKQLAGISVLAAALAGMWWAVVPRSGDSDKDATTKKQTWAGDAPNPTGLTPSYMKSEFSLRFERRGAGLPVEFFKDLVLVNAKGESTNLTKMSQLKGTVDIRSSDEATNFVRLRTSYALYLWFENPTLEILSQRRVRQLEPNREPTIPYQQGRNGIVKDLDFATLADSYPRVTKERGRFVVERLLIKQNPQIHAVTTLESVSEDGTYQLESEKPASALSSAKIQWTFPDYD